MQVVAAQTSPIDFAQRGRRLGEENMFTPDKVVSQAMI